MTHQEIIKRNKEFFKTGHCYKAIKTAYLKIDNGLRIGISYRKGEKFCNHFPDGCLCRDHAKDMYGDEYDVYPIYEGDQLLEEILEDITPQKANTATPKAKQKISTQKVLCISAILLCVLSVLTFFFSLCKRISRQEEMISQQQTIIRQQNDMVNTYHIMMRTVENHIDQQKHE